MVMQGVRPLTEAELADKGPGPLLATAYHGAEVLRWSARVYPATSFLLPISLRRALLRLAGLKIGAHVGGLRHCGFQTKNVTIGDGSWVNVGCWFEGAGQIEIGRNAFIGPQVMIITSHHPIDENGEVERMPEPSKVRIGERCWIGARATIMPGVTIGDGTVIGAGSVVTRDCDPGAVYVGVPARRVRLQNPGKAVKRLADHVEQLVVPVVVAAAGQPGDGGTGEPQRL
jgi:maltose O-acetyltransferase